MIKVPGCRRLPCALAFVLSAVNIVSVAEADFDSARGTVPAVILAVRFALPFFVLAFIASSAAVLWPSRVTRWLVLNRRYLGLSFAFGMAWHFALVGYYLAKFGVHLNPTIVVLDLVGLLFLLALTLTSFRAFAVYLSAKSWRRLHKAGVYAIWLLAIFIYIESVRWGPNAFDWVALIVLLAAWVLRLFASRRQCELRRGGLHSLSRRSAIT
jgi:sulfoxide reductase heme-binding subunit YedZ